MNRMYRRLLTFHRAAQGMALIEFAIVMPVLFLMILGILEVSRAIVIAQRVEKAAYVLSDVTTQYLPATLDMEPGEITENDVRTVIIPQLERIMGIYADPTRQRVIISSVQKKDGDVLVKWQVASAQYTLNRTGVVSIVNGFPPGAIGPGVQDGFTTFPGVDISGMAEDENMIVVEVFYYYEPIWAEFSNAVVAARQGEDVDISRPQLFVKRLYMRPRAGNLVCLPPDFMYADCE